MVFIEFRAAGWRVEDTASGMLTLPPPQNCFMFFDFSSLCDCTTTQLEAFCWFQLSQREKRRISLSSRCSFDAKGHGFFVQRHLSIYQ